MFFLEIPNSAATGNHKRVNILYDPSHFVLQQLDYITYIDHYHEFIKAFHVKDSNLNLTEKGVPLVDMEIGKIVQDAIALLEMDKSTLKRFLQS